MLEMHLTGFQSELPQKVIDVVELVWARNPKIFCSPLWFHKLCGST